MPTRTESQLDLNGFLCFSIYETNQAFNQFYRPLLEKIGLTYTQYLVLVSLWTRDNQTVKDIGQAVSLESSTLTPLLKRLEKLGLIGRARDAEDERQTRITLTEKGSKLREDAAVIPACVSDALGMSAQQIADVQRLMQSMRANLRKAAARCRKPGISPVET